MKAPRLKPGNKVKFLGMKRPFPVVAHNRYFTICAYRLTGCLAEKQFVYTIIDWANERRGPDCMIFGPHLDYTKPKDAAKALKDLGDGKYHRKIWRKPGASFGKYVLQGPKLETSRRRSIPLDIEKVIQ